LKAALENKGLVILFWRSYISDKMSPYSDTAIALYPAILFGLSSVVAWLPEYVRKEAISLAVEYLRSPFKEIRSAAVTALVTLGATETSRYALNPIKRHLKT